MNTCDCESYDCKGECCGVGNCTCTTVRSDGMPDMPASLAAVLAMLEPKRLFEMVTKTFKAMADRSTVEYAVFNTDRKYFDMDDEAERRLFFEPVRTFDTEEAATQRARVITAERNRQRNDSWHNKAGRYASHAQRYRGPVVVRKRTVIRSDWEDIGEPVQ